MIKKINKIMNEELKNQWLPVLKDIGINEYHYEKVLRYIDMFLIDNSLYGTIDNKRQEILPLSLKILSRIDLSKVDFINYPMGMEDITLRTNNMDYVIDEVFNFINNKLNEGFEVKIYKVIQSIIQDNNEFNIHIRMNFHKPGEYKHNYVDIQI